MDLLHRAVGAYVIYHDVLFCEANKAPAESPTGICQPTFPHHQQHPNKRRKIVDRIFPFHSAAEITAFDAIPSQLKIDLVDSIIKTAVPGLDDLLAAASSVVSVCLDAEAESWERNKAILELKDVLDIFGVALQGSGQEESKTEVDVGQESNEEYTILNRERDEQRTDQPVEVHYRESGLDNAVEQHNVNIEPQKTPTPSDLQPPDTFQDEKQYVSRGTQYIQPSYDDSPISAHHQARYSPHSPYGSRNQTVRRPTPQGPVQQSGYGNDNTLICCRCSHCTAESYERNEEESHQHESGYITLPGQSHGEVSRGGGKGNANSTGSVPRYLHESDAHEDLSIPHAHNHREQGHQPPQDRYQQQYGRPHQYPPHRPEKSPHVNHEHNWTSTHQMSHLPRPFNNHDQREHTGERQFYISSYHPTIQRLETEVTSSDSFSTASAPTATSKTGSSPSVDGIQHSTHAHRFPQTQLTNTNLNNHTNPSQQASHTNTTTYPRSNPKHQDKQRQPNLGTSLLGKRKTPPQTQNQPHNRTQNQSQAQTQNQQNPKLNRIHNHSHPHKSQKPNPDRASKTRNDDSGKPNPGNKTKAPVAPMLHVRRLGMFEGMRS